MARRKSRRIAAALPRGRLPEDAARLVAIAPGHGLERAAEAARGYLAASRAGATWRAYDKDLEIFARWCRSHGVRAFPATAETVALFLSAEAAEQGRKPSTIERRLSAILVAHRQKGLALDRNAPVLRDVMAGILRTHGAEPESKDALDQETLAAMVEACGDDLRGCRDRGILLLGFAACRRARSRRGRSRPGPESAGGQSRGLLGRWTPYHE